MQFVYGTCDVTGCFNAKGILDSLLFILGIYSSFSLHIKHVIELAKIKEFRFISLKTTG